MVIWHVSRDLGLVENQFLWQIPLALACFFGLAYSLLDDVVEWVEEKGEKVKEAFGCEEGELLSDKLVEAVEDGIDKKIAGGNSIFESVGTAFVCQLIAGLITVLVGVVFALYILVNEQFQQTGFFFITDQAFFQASGRLLKLFTQLGDQVFFPPAEVLFKTFVIMMNLGVIKKIAGWTKILSNRKWHLVAIILKLILLTFFAAVSLLEDFNYFFMANILYSCAHFCYIKQVYTYFVGGIVLLFKVLPFNVNYAMLIFLFCYIVLSIFIYSFNIRALVPFYLILTGAMLSFSIIFSSVFDIYHNVNRGVILNTHYDDYCNAIVPIIFGLTFFIFTIYQVLRIRSELIKEQLK